MKIREASPRLRNSSIPTKPPKKHSGGVVLIALILLALAMSWSFLGTSQANGDKTVIKSGWKGYCLDDYQSKLDSGNQVDLWNCNGTSAQDWKVGLTQISRDNNLCLSADSKNQITVNSCDQSPNQVWIEDDTGFLNPALGLCLSANKAGQDQGLSMESCTNMSSSAKSWNPSVNLLSYQCPSAQGQAVACNAIKQWISWTSEPNSHTALLNSYTGGASYEEWCADFVSYIYKQSGHPFTNGNYSGWDENVAGDVVNQGFTVDSSPDYVPRAGDVAYFDYNGGHVEIVVVGGKTPTFIYGNSGQIDPTTGNGEMAANNLTSDPSLGSLQYYMTPNSST